MAIPSISVTIITKNEEANIRRCLESVKWADEIVVVDSGSDDGTLDICREYGCRIFEHEWEGYGGQKDFALRQAASEWILSVDADEEIPPELAKEIRLTLSSANPADGYLIPMRNLFFGKWMGHGGWYPDRHLRLFRRKSARFKKLSVHEYVEFDCPAGIERLASPIRHYSYQSANQFLRKTERYTDLQSEAMIAEGRVPRYPALALLTAFPLKFAEVYLYKQGWRDGIHGFVAAMLVAFRVYMRTVKVWAHTMKEPD